MGRIKLNSGPAITMAKRCHSGLLQHARARDPCQRPARLLLHRPGARSRQGKKRETILCGAGGEAKQLGPKPSEKRSTLTRTAWPPESAPAHGPEPARRATPPRLPSTARVSFACLPGSHCCVAPGHADGLEQLSLSTHARRCRSRRAAGISFFCEKGPRCHLRHVPRGDRSAD